MKFPEDNVTLRFKDLESMCNIKLTSFYEGVIQVLEEIKIERQSISRNLLYDSLPKHFTELFNRLRDHSVRESFNRTYTGLIDENR